MTTKHEPTPGAMRGARRILIELITKEENADNPVWACFTEHMTAIIDRETGLPELLEACQKYIELDNDRRAGCIITDSDWAECHQCASAAIAKATAER